MKSLFSFIEAGVSPFHAVKEAGRRLGKEGFVRLSEMDSWQLEAGRAYYVTRNESSIVAFRMPEEKPEFYHLTASHSDSPTFRVKKGKMEGKYYARAEVEGYGGMIYSSWLDRPLGVAGRVALKTEKGIETRLVAPDCDLFVIPNLAIHMNRDMNKGYEYNPQVDLQPLYGGEDCDLDEWLAEDVLQVDSAAVVDSDLFLVVREKGRKLGIGGQYYMAPRIDDLACACTTLEGFLAASGKSSQRKMNVWCMFDNEEVGSGTRQGAMGTFLPTILSRVEDFYGMTREESMIARSKSYLISADNAHATHPNLPEKTDKEFPVVLNGGIVIKHNASQKYTTTGMTSAVFERLCRDNGIAVQHFANRADSPGGSTLGNLLSHAFSVPMIDIGLPQLAMHSAVETAGGKDAEEMVKAMQIFYESSLHQTKDGEWNL